MGSISQLLLYKLFLQVYELIGLFILFTSG